MNNSQKENVWSERAHCYKVIVRNGKTFFYYRCLDTNKTKRLQAHGVNLSKSAYLNRTFRLLEIVN